MAKRPSIINRIRKDSQLASNYVRDLEENYAATQLKQYPSKMTLDFARPNIDSTQALGEIALSHGVSMIETQL